MAKENTGWFSRYAWGVKVQWLKHLFLFFALRCCQGGLQTAPVKPWQLLSAKVLSEITGREEPMGRAEAVLRLRLQGYGRWSSGGYDDRKWTFLCRYVGPCFVEAGIADTGMNLSWRPTILPGGDPFFVDSVIEGWFEEQDCLDGLAAIAALDANLPRSLANLDVRDVPVSLGIAALDAFSVVIPRIFPDCIDFNEVSAEALSEQAVQDATGSGG